MHRYGASAPYRAGSTRCYSSKDKFWGWSENTSSTLKSVVGILWSTSWNPALSSHTCPLPDNNIPILRRVRFSGFVKTDSFPQEFRGAELLHDRAEFIAFPFLGYGLYGGWSGSCIINLIIHTHAVFSGGLCLLWSNFWFLSYSP